MLIRTYHGMFGVTLVERCLFTLCLPSRRLVCLFGKTSISRSADLMKTLRLHSATLISALKYARQDIEIFIRRMPSYIIMNQPREATLGTTPNAVHSRGTASI